MRLGESRFDTGRSWTRERVEARVEGGNKQSKTAFVIS